MTIKNNNFTLKANSNVKCKLIIPQQIVEEIEMYHQNYPGKEWSGPIFYDILEGSFTEGDLVLRINDLAIADAGSEAYTEYSFNELLKDDYWFDKQALSKQGGLHTHHNMPCFFSGTDNQELTDNTHRYIHPDDFYLSVIVNGKGTHEWIARICKRISSQVTVTEEKVVKSYTQRFAEKYPWLTSKFEMQEDGTIVPKTEDPVVRTSRTVDEEEYLYTDCELEFEDSNVDYKQCLKRLQSFLKLKDNKSSYRSFPQTHRSNTNYASREYEGQHHLPFETTKTSEELAYLKNTLSTNFIKMYNFKVNYGSWDTKSKEAPNGYSLLNSPVLLKWFEDVCEDLHDHFNCIKSKIPTLSQLTEVIKELDRFEKGFVSTIHGKSRHESDQFIKQRIKDLKVFRDLFLEQYWKEYHINAIPEK